MLVSRGRFSMPNALLKNELALKSSRLANQNAEPRSSFVPDFVMTVIAAPPAMPVSASKLLVATLTVSIVSAGCTYIAWCGSQTLTDTAPSSRVVLAFGCTPFTHVRSERPGVSISAFWNCTGVAPGTRFISDW